MSSNLNFSFQMCLVTCLRSRINPFLPELCMGTDRGLLSLHVQYCRIDSIRQNNIYSICCRSENCISLAISGQSAVDSIDSFDLSNGKVCCRFDKCGRPSDNCISALVTTATRCKIVESIGSFDWWKWLFHSRFHIKSLSNRRVHVNED